MGGICGAWWRLSRAHLPRANRAESRPVKYLRIPQETSTGPSRNSHPQTPSHGHGIAMRKASGARISRRAGACRKIRLRPRHRGMATAVTTCPRGWPQGALRRYRAFQCRATANKFPAHSRSAAPGNTATRKQKDPPDTSQHHHTSPLGHQTVFAELSR